MDPKEKEVQARVRFKMGQIRSALKQRLMKNWAHAFNTGEPKYEHYWEAFKKFIKMVDKEIDMAVPSDEMAEESRRKARDEAVNKIFDSLSIQGHQNWRAKRRMIANAVEEAQKY